MSVYSRQFMRYIGQPKDNLIPNKIYHVMVYISNLHILVESQEIGLHSYENIISFCKEWES